MDENRSSYELGLEELEELQKEIKDWRKECLDKIATITNHRENREEIYKYHVQKVSFERRFNFLQKQIRRKQHTRKIFEEGIWRETQQNQIKKFTFKLMGSCYIQPVESIDERVAFLCKLSIFLHDSDISPSKLKTFDELIRREIYFIKCAEDSKLQFNSLLLGVRLRLASEFAATFKSRMN